MAAHTVTDLRSSYAAGDRPVLGLVERDGCGLLAAARAAPDRLLHLFQGAEAELTVRRLAGPALCDAVTGRQVLSFPMIAEANEVYRSRRSVGYAPARASGHATVSGRAFPDQKLENRKSHAP
jgi:hypothetical protein